MTRLRRAFAWSLAVVVLLVSMGSIAGAAMRPGGGSSFSGGSGSSRSSGSSSSRSSSSSGSWSSGSGSSYGGSSGSGDFGLIGLLLSTGFGGFSFIGVIVFLAIVSMLMQRRGLALDWQAGVGDGGQARRERIRPLLEQIRAEDPNFSLVLLEDFLYALYAQAQTLRGGGALERLSAYLKPPARASLSSLGNVR